MFHNILRDDIAVTDQHNLTLSFALVSRIPSEVVLRETHLKCSRPLNEHDV